MTSDGFVEAELDCSVIPEKALHSEHRFRPGFADGIRDTRSSSGVAGIGDQDFSLTGFFFWQVQS